LSKITNLWPSSLSSPGYIPLSGERDVKKVPFVETFNTRLQGVISSASDIARVYVAYFDTRTLNYCCSTNNNRPCGGLRGYPCNHLRELLHEAVIQYGINHVRQFLQLPSEAQTENDILQRCGQQSHTYNVSDIFSRFLGDLELLELPTLNTPLTVMAWFNT
jgi:hypothetical protein